MTTDDPNNDRTPTLADVARLAKVSTATVSRCLNSPDRVIEKTRTKVLAAVRDLGYAPNFNARALAAKHTNTIGAIIPTMENAIFARALQAFQEELGGSGVTLLVASSSYRADLEEEQIRTLVSRGADGILLIGYHRDPKIYEFLQRQGVPIVVAWVFDPQADVLTVGFDNFTAMKALADKVISMGHRRIATITANPEYNDRASERLRGIRAAMSEAGISATDLSIVESAYGIDEGGKALEQILAQPVRPSVVMCGNDVLAVGAIARAKELGLRVPEDISVTGFDDIEIAKISSPPLTTVHVPHRRMGKEAARMLINLVNATKDQKNTLIETSLKIRSSLSKR
ncbi:LacI family DNA-binding transcriptional regulator [Parasedimentitalea marina]|uniref:LacI family DNA-binding transcriptional regulator n=1 Tax=Parasedimentitalea marina TaxID=2483033 RepID=A0A3T0N4F7_9RHOB|nr:LacI family DNA-binding transcriptional regulator [Parasedimentitalea marina]AZV78916.1 LacI family DNA-binding transcriptional regulator [Parasedimentitalea marina]